MVEIKQNDVQWISLKCQFLFVYNHMQALGIVQKLLNLQVPSSTANINPCSYTYNIYEWHYAEEIHSCKIQQA